MLGRKTVLPLVTGSAVIAVSAFLLLAESQTAEKNAATNNAVRSAQRAARSGACAAALRDGTILITGGNVGNGPQASTEIFSARQGAKDGAPMSFARLNHSCATLADGRILVAGGTTSGGATVNSSEIYNPQTNTWTIGPAMTAARSGSAAVAVGGGKIVIAGGESNGNATATLEVYDPAAGRFSAVPGQMSVPRMQHATVVLKDGRVLIAGGTDGRNTHATIDVYDPATNSISTFGTRMATARAGLSATVLLDGRVYFAGGVSGTQEQATTEILDPVKGTLTAGPQLLTARAGHVAIRVPNNNAILITGGNVRGGVVQSQELFIPWQNRNRNFAPGNSARSEEPVGSKVSAKSAAVANAAASDSADTPVLPTLITDKSDYSPGETAYITGSGWPADATVSLALTRDPKTSQDTSWTATTDADGNLSTSYHVIASDYGVTFTLTGTSGDDTAQISQSITFTDGLTINSFTIQDSSCAGSAVSVAALNATICANANVVAGTKYRIQWYNSATPSAGSLVYDDTGTASNSGYDASAAVPHVVNSSGVWTILICSTGNPGLCSNGNQKSPQQINVGAQSQTISTSIPTNVTFADPATTISATASSGLPVTFSVASGPCAISNVSSGSPTTATLSTTGAGQCSITVSQAGSSLWSAASVSRTVNVGQASTTVTVTGGTFIYDGTAKAATATVTGNGGFSQSVSVTYSGSCSVAPVTVAEGTSCTATASFAGNTNYSSSTGNATVTINKRSATVTTAAGSKIYGSADPIPLTTTTLDNFVAADGISASFTRTSGETVGAYPITATLAPAPALANYNVTYNSVNFTIGRKSASVTPAAAAKTYGAADPTLTGTLSGFVPADNVTATYTRTAGESVGPYTISASLSPAGVLANYDITSNTATFSITPRTASVTVASTSKTYGDADPVFSGTLSGFLPADNVTATYSRTTGESFGTYAISATLSPAGVLGNYSITNTPGTLSITKRSATVVIDAKSKVYGSSDPLLTGTLSGFLQGDGITATYGRSSGETVAAYPITATLNPAPALANYNIVTTGASLTITRKPASATATAASKTFGAADPSLAGTLSGFLPGDSVTAVWSRTAGEDAGGSYTISATLSPAGVLGNYDVTYNTAAFTIDKASSTVTVTGGGSFVYDATAKTASATVTGAGGLSQSVPVTYQGTCAGAAPVTVAQGTSCSATATFAGDSNHEGSTGNSVTISITKKDATVTPTAASKVFGSADPVLAGTLSGFVDAVTPTWTRAAGENVGSYAMSATLSPAAVLANYNVSTASVNFTITKATPTVTLTGTGSFVYDGTAKTAGATVTGPGGLSQNLTVVYGGSCVGAAPVTVAAGTSCAVSASYPGSDNYNTASAQGTVVITPRPASVTPAPGSKYAGTADPALTGTLSGFIPSDGVTATYGRVAGETVGTYTISVNGVSPAGVLGNYSITTSTAVFTINIRPTSLILSGPSSLEYGKCSTGTYSAVLRDLVGNAPISGVQVSFRVGTQTATALTDASGTAAVLMTVSQIGNISAAASWPGTPVQAPGVSNTLSVAIAPSTTVGPLPGESIYTGPTLAWTASSTTSTATVTLSATLKDTTGCGDIRVAKVTFATRNADGSYTPIPSAQNLPVGLVSATDATVGSASAIVQFNIGNQKLQQMTIAVILSGNYTRNNLADDALVTIAQPGLANSMVGNGQINLLGDPASSGLLATKGGLVAGEDGWLRLQANVTYAKPNGNNKDNTLQNPQGGAIVKFNSMNRADGTLDSVMHTYLIKTTSIASLTQPAPGTLSFTAKGVLQEVTGGVITSLDGGVTVQITTENSSSTHPNGRAVVSVTSSKGSGTWVASGWSGTAAVLKDLAGGQIVGQ